MSLVFRSGTEEDVPAVARLVMHSFPAVNRSQTHWEGVLRDSPIGGIETLFVGEDGDEIVAVCRLYRYEQWIGGRRLPVMGLGMVAIAATARRRGLGGRMCAAALEEARARGFVATALYPFRTSFYGKLGYGVAGEVLQYRIPPSDLPDDPGRSRVSLVDSDEGRAQVAAVYDRWAPTQTGQMVRPDRAWELVWQEGTRHGALFHGDDGPSGYAIFRYLAEPGRGNRTVDVEEVVWLDAAARRGLYGWLASLSDQWDAILYRARPDEGFAEHLRELRHPDDSVPRWHFWFPSAAVLNGPMFRILDLEMAWGMRSVRPGPALTLALEVQDEQLSANAGSWLLTFAGGSAMVERTGSSQPDARFTVGIRELSRIFIGALAPSTAVSVGLAGIDRPDVLERLDDLLRVPKPWTFDRF